MTEQEQKDQQEAQEQRELLAEMIAGAYDYTQPRRGEIREAVILSIGENDIVVDLGLKRDGIVSPRDLQQVDRDYVKSLQVGDHIPVAILRAWGDQEGLPVSLSRGLQQNDWLRAEKLLESGELVECEVVDYNRGGVLVQFGRLNGFVPNSHLGALPSGTRQGRDVDPKADLVGQKLMLAVIEVNQPRRRLVMSKRAADRRRRHELIHISELDWKRVERPGDVVSVGDEVEVLVLSVDRERERIGLSRKRVLPDPWTAVTNNLSEGQVVEGRVSSLASFGVFVSVGEGVEGLVHTSEMGDLAPDALQPGDLVRVEVLSIDHAQRQIALRLAEPVDSSTDEGSAVPEA